MNSDRDVRELLRAKASEMPPSSGIPGDVLKRSKRRRALVASAVSLALVIAGAGAVAGVTAMTERPHFDPVRPAPSRTERGEDESTRRREVGVVDPTEVAMVDVADGDRPDGSRWVLRVGRSGDSYCAELLPEGDGSCWAAGMLTDRFPIDVVMQGASSTSSHQYVMGAADDNVARVTVRSKGGYSTQATTHRGPSELGRDARFFVAFAPKNSPGRVIGYDGAGNAVTRLRFARLFRASGGCAGDPELASEGSAPTWPVPAIGPIELFAMSFSALITSGSECATAVQYLPPRRTDSSNP
jgi:hypothetical protein